MKKLLFLLVVLTSISCQEKNYTNADLSFKLINAGSLYGADESEIQKFEEILDSLRRNQKAKKNEIELFNFYAKLKDHNLLTSPYIYLQIEKDSTLRVYLHEEEYQKVKEYNHADLNERNKKVSLKLDIEKKEEGIYVANHIISVQETDGHTIVVK